ncbi:uncharacterized protein LOC118274922 [Spodoptera frugiperda]|uniref:Uncharacterized protein LOC118274922 n=1 Tax=Spodoptera frugiperda TaxID=7108 RepID=A0A9R0DYD1_SPOFR|nr:uncharacterized protein LOC118274922 [Spodoptera frugiperda]
MARSSVCLFLFLLSYVYTAPVPENAKISLIRNSSFGFGLAAGKSKTAGIFEGNNNFNIFKDIGGRRPDFTLLENVNSGAAFAFDQSISIGVIKNNIFGGKNPFSG